MPGPAAGGAADATQDCAVPPTASSAVTRSVHIAARSSERESRLQPGAFNSLRPSRFRHSCGPGQPYLSCPKDTAQPWTRTAPFPEGPALNSLASEDQPVLGFLKAHGRTSGFRSQLWEADQVRARLPLSI